MVSRAALPAHRMYEGITPVLPLVVPLLLLGALSLSAQGTGESTIHRRSPGAPWRLYGGWTVNRLADINGWGNGPVTSIGRTFGGRASGRFGVRLDLAIILNSDGFYDFGGIAPDLGVTYSIGGERVEATAGFGPSLIFGSDSDGTLHPYGGGHLGLEAIAWVIGPLGLYGRGAVRYMSSGDFHPSASGGLVVRF